jgi:hypothetical protein
MEQLVLNNCRLNKIKFKCTYHPIIEEKIKKYF